MINSKRKGNAGELEAAAKLTAVMGLYAHRTQQYSGQGHGLSHAPDLMVYEDEERTQPASITVEVKREENLVIRQALEKLTSEMGDGRNIAVLLHRPNGKPWMVTIWRRDVDRLLVYVSFLARRGIGTSEEMKILATADCNARCYCLDGRSITGLAVACRLKRRCNVVNELKDLRLSAHRVDACIVSHGIEEVEMVTFYLEELCAITSVWVAGFNLKELIEEK